jgi:hypothetical protein
MQYGFGPQAQQQRPPPKPMGQAGPPGIGLQGQAGQRMAGPARPMPGAVQGANPSFAFGAPRPGIGPAQPGAQRAAYGQQQMMGRPGAGQMFGQQPQQGGGYGQQQQGGMNQQGAGGRCPTCGK